MVVIGLSGGTATGKSTVSTILAERGFHVIYADLLGHESYEPHTSTYTQLVNTFGQSIVSNEGKIERKKLGDIVFNDVLQMKSLTNIVWPAIRKLAAERIQSYRHNHPTIPIVFEAAILLEAGWQDFVDEVWVVVAPRDQIMARAVKRDRTTPDKVLTRIRSQLGDEARISQANVCINNNGSLAHLKSAVNQEISTLYERFKT